MVIYIYAKLYNIYAILKCINRNVTNHPFQLLSYIDPHQKDYRSNTFYVDKLIYKNSIKNKNLSILYSKTVKAILI